MRVRVGCGILRNPVQKNGQQYRPYLTVLQLPFSHNSKRMLKARSPYCHRASPRLGQQTADQRRGMSHARATRVRDASTAGGRRHPRRTEPARPAATTVNNATTERPRHLTPVFVVVTVIRRHHVTLPSADVTRRDLNDLNSSMT